MNIKELVYSKKTLSPVSKMLQTRPYLVKELKEVTSFLKEEASQYQRLFHIKHKIFNIVKCRHCNNEAIFVESKSRYRKSCGSEECSSLINKLKFKNLTLEQKNKRKEKIVNAIKNFSKEKRAEITRKIKNTTLKNHGKESYAQTEKFKKHMKENYGYVSAFELKYTHEKSKETLIERTGYDHNFKIPEVIENRKQTFLENYGYEHAVQNEKIKEHARNTCLERYGEISPMRNSDIKQKSLETLIKNYGVNSPLQHPELLKKQKKTMMDKYGYENVFHNEDILQSVNDKAHRYKKYQLNGIEIYLQGYEDYALYEILLKKYEEKDIFTNKQITKEIGQIFYIKNEDGVESRHKYYPDFYVKSVHKIYEVKGSYTYSKEINNEFIKRNTCIEMGLNFEYLLIDFKVYKDWKKTFIKPQI